MLSSDYYCRKVLRKKHKFLGCIEAIHLQLKAQQDQSGDRQQLRRSHLSSDTLIWPSNPDRQIQRIQIFCSNWTHPWANSHLCLTKPVIIEKKATVHGLGENMSILQSVSLWESMSSYASKRNWATEEKRGKGLDSNLQDEHASDICAIHDQQDPGTEISLQLNPIPGSSRLGKNLREFAVIQDFCSARWQKSCEVTRLLAKS